MQFPSEEAALVWSIAGILATLMAINPALVVILGLLAITNFVILARRRG